MQLERKLFAMKIQNIYLHCHKETLRYQTGKIAAHYKNTTSLQKINVTWSLGH